MQCSHQEVRGEFRTDSRPGLATCRYDEEAMENTMSNYTNSSQDRARRALFGVAAAVATAATLGLAVLAPLAAAPGEPMVQALINHKRLVLGPAEVAIVPSSIEVIATRTPHTDPVAAPVAAGQRV